ncbi:MFS transporter [Deinococcus altitudinis]|uniref:MFS transporter n=1 Tax=Deinococcus altitudinis TaxID=468914 RepID=UPI0038925FA8
MLATLVAVGCARLAFGTVLPEMRRDLHLSYTQSGSLGTLTALGYLILLLPAGLLARRWSNRGSVLLGLCLVTAGFVGLWQGHGFPLIQAMMLLLGVGTAFVFTPLVALLTGWFPQQRGTVIGLASSGVGLGLLLAGLLVPRLEHLFGTPSWRLVWAVYAGLGTLSVVLSVLVLRDPPRSAPGTAEESSGLAVYLDPGVLQVGLGYGLGGFAYSIQVLFMLSYMLAQGVSSSVAGLLVAINGLVSVFAGVGWGWLSDRLGRGPAMILAATLSLLATLAPTLAPSLVSFSVYWVVIGLTISGLFTLFQAAGTEQVSRADVPIALSAITLFYALGQLIGPALAGRVLDSAGGFRATFLLTALALLLSAAVSLSLHRSARRERPQA